MKKNAIGMVLVACGMTLPVTAEANLTPVKNNEADIHVDSTAVHSEHKLGEVVVNGRKQTYTEKDLSSTLRLNMPIIQIPQNIHVLTKDVLDDLGIASADEGIQRTVSGVSKLEHWGDYLRINARGSRMAAFREGMNFTSTWGPMTEDMSYVDRIEFVKGPAGFMMSNGEPAGLYNVVTKKPTGYTRGNASITLGSYDYYRAALDLDGHLDKQNKLQYRFNVMGMSTNSMRANEFTKRYSIAPVLRYLINDKTTLTLEYDLQYMQSSDIGGSYIFSPFGYKSVARNYSLIEPGMEPTKAYDHTVILNFQHQLSDNWKLTAQGSYSNYARTGTSLWAYNIEENGNMDRYVTNADVLNEMKFGQIYLNGKAQTGKVSHKIMTGLDMNNKHAWYDWSQSYALDSTGTFNVFRDTPSGTPYYGYPQFDRTKDIKERANNTQITQSSYGLYLQDVLGFFNDKLLLTLAGRFTHVEDASYGTTQTKENHFSPRVGLTYNLDDNTSFYALYDQTFSPQMGQLRNGNKVKPIVSNNWEIGAKRNWFDGRLQTSLSLYSILIDNQISADPENTGSENYYIQVGQSVSKGIELDINGEILPGLNLLANYALTNYKVTKSEDPTSPVGTHMPGYAKHQFNVWFKYQVLSGFLKGFHIGLGETSLIDRSTWTFADGINEEPLPNYIRVDGSLGWKNDKLSVLLNVNNIMNAYLLSGCKYGNYYVWQSEPGRTFRMTLSYNF
ncbi:TonB-dependent siderophore receptor [Segatella bryantii]|uniref:TonB-dependent siderophore receptor n=1 Tax=Segatella bryantii TaxID=77095 RepID=UPI0024203E4B|nr:TonB-dependent siderophore receptor [Segatella bryantii]